ncbi:MAG: single-stranded DNA-binding protein [Planctomycetes bacterium]|nr:single-stranded DNA-binding protein [Planctomycetota bacterium]
MASVNWVVLAGCLAADVKLQRADGGTLVANLPLLVRERRERSDGKPTSRSVLVDVETRNRLAEECERHLRKNSPVMIEGSLQMIERLKKSGKNRPNISIRASRVHFLGARRHKGDTAGMSAAGA